MSLVSGWIERLTVTPLLYACGVLLLVCLGLGVALKLEAADVATAEADKRTAEADRNTAQTEREAWKRRAGELGTANLAYGVALSDLRAELALCQGENARLGEAGEKAVAAAQADARDADRTLAAFTAKFQTESRKPQCAAALHALDAACPALEGY